jgi:hypothetical protein
MAQTSSPRAGAYEPGVTQPEAGEIRAQEDS